MTIWVLGLLSVGSFFPMNAYMSLQECRDALLHNPKAYILQCREYKPVLDWNE